MHRDIIRQCIGRGAKYLKSRVILLGLNNMKINIYRTQRPHDGIKLKNNEELSPIVHFVYIMIQYLIDEMQGRESCLCYCMEGKTT